MTDGQLWTLLGAYYHEDFEGVWETFDLYARDASPAQLKLLSDEIETLLSSTPIEDVPAETWRLGSVMWLGNEPGPYVEWLSEIRRRSLQLIEAGSE